MLYGDMFATVLLPHPQHAMTDALVRSKNRAEDVAKAFAEAVDPDPAALERFADEIRRIAWRNQR